MLGPNTTQVPNEIIDKLQRQMSDTDLRVVLTVARKTLGWILSPQTGMRVEDDSISHLALAQIIGREPRAISRSIQKCCAMGWIEVRNKQGQPLATASARTGQKLYYRLGQAILSTPKETPPVDNFSKPVSQKHGFLNTLSNQPVDNFVNLCHNDIGSSGFCQDLCHNDIGCIYNVPDRVRVIGNINYINDIDSDKRNFKKVDELSIEAQEFEKLVDRCRYLSEKMSEPKYLGLYIKIAKQIGIELLERAIGLAREDNNIKNKGAYMVKICQTYGYKPAEKPPKITE